MATYPATLPQSPLVRGYSSKRVPNQLNFETDVGPSKSRRRSTATPIVVTENYVLENSEKLILEEFYEVTLKSGTEAFSKTNPETGNTDLYKFRDSPQFEKVGTLWTTSLSLEIQP